MPRKKNKKLSSVIDTPHVERITNRGRLVVENAEIVYPNFSGRPGRYNQEGDRNFCVVLEDPDIVQTLKDENWNVKARVDRDTDEVSFYYLPVKIKYSRGGKGNKRNPLIVLYTSTSRTNISENRIDILDYADILNVDLELNPYNYNRDDPDHPMYSAYLKVMHVTIEDDPFEEKYSGLYDDEDETDDEEEYDESIPF